MKFHSVAIFVKAIERSKDFYMRLLDQKIEHDFGTNIIFEGGLSIWEVSKDHIISKKLSSKNSTNNFELYFVNDSLDEIFARLKKENVEFVHEIQEEPWGQRNFRFFDPDKHLIEIAEPLHVFVNNMHNKGLSIEEISEKSGIQIKTVTEIINQKN